MDDPWVPQYGAADVLEDLGAAGIDGDAGLLEADHRHGLLAAAPGPARQGLRDRDADADRVPFVGDLQTLTYRNDVYTRRRPKTWDELIAKGKDGVEAGQDQVPASSSAASPATRSSPPGTRSSCPTAASSSTTSGTSPSTRAGQGVGRLLRRHDEAESRRRASSSSTPTRRARAILGGEAGAIIQYTGNAIKADDPKQSKVVGKLDFGVVPKQVKAIAQIGIFIHGVSASAPNKDNAITFLKWYATDAGPGDARAMPARARPHEPFADRGSRGAPADADGLRQQLDAGCPAASAHARLGEGRGTDPRHRAATRRSQAGSGGGARSTRRQAVDRPT